MSTLTGSPLRTARSIARQLPTPNLQFPRNSQLPTSNAQGTLNCQLPRTTADGEPSKVGSWKLAVGSWHLGSSLEPPRDRDLLIRVEIEGVAAVHLQVAEEAVAGAAEGEVGHRR